jgi:hypothetical protein
MQNSLPWQIWVALSAPSALAILGILLNQSRLNSLETNVTRRIERIEDKVESLTALVHSKVKEALRRGVIREPDGGV